MSEPGAPSLQRYPSTADTAPPTPGAWCSSCFGIRWWTERHEPKGWRGLTCHPPDHLTAEAIRHENEAGDALAPAAPRASHAGDDPLCRQAGLSLDDEG
jgi:hypothetical protein